MRESALIRHDSRFPWYVWKSHPHEEILGASNSPEARKDGLESGTFEILSQAP